MMQDSIPSYYQYGETDTTEELEFIHCSPVFSRIKEYNWQIKPHRHNSLHQIIMLLQGSISTHLETRAMIVQSPAIIVIPAGHVHGFDYDESAKGQVTTISDAFMRSACGEEHAAWLTQLLHKISTFQMLSNQPGENPVIRYLQDIDREFRTPSPGRVAIVAALLKLVILHLGRNLELQQVMAADNPHYIRIFETFRQLVDQHHREHIPISEYCKLLAVGERQLNRICKTLINTSPSRYIQRYLTQEAKRNLIYTQKPVTQICYELGFSDPGYFSRFFSKQTGSFPKEYISRHRDAKY